MAATDIATKPILELSGVIAGYGAGDILKGVDLTITAGTVTCLIGPNGAGKSTVLKAVSGLIKPRLGSIRHQGREIGALSPKSRLLLGIAQVPQERSLFPAMSVADNLLMGGHLVKDKKLVRERIEAAIEMFPICARRRHEHAGSLSGGEQKQVELARTLVLDPKIVLLDEPSIGLDPGSRKLVFESVTRLAATGRAVLLVEQNARSGLAVSDFGAVLEAGTVRLTGTGSGLLQDPEVARLYLGATPRPVVPDAEDAPSGGPDAIRKAATA